MKHFMQPRNAILRENSFDTPPLNPSSMKQNRPSNRKQKSCKENAPPSDLNAIPDSSPSPCFTGKPSPSVASKLKSVLPPRPPSSNPLKRKLCTDLHPENGVSGSSDTGVKVIVRMRPPNKNEGDTIVQKTSGDSLSILGQQFTFDSVADATSTQIDIFQLVGAPLVENCLAGFNSSIFAYGQTGSGKTYTIWGPANALVEEHSSSSEPGLTPRVFERLFSRIKEEQNKHADKQLVYQCHCSFLEIYNEQITDLLSPSQRNLHLREDTKTGVYVENLTEETICNMNEVRQLLKKGLSNRKTGATSVNFESSRSHSVFTCVIESRCKSVDGLSCFKTSRMNLVDLAGSERQKSTGTAGERLKEAGNINRSLSQLGNLINILAEVSQTGKQRHIPYRDSKLTFLLQESLGGNAKLAMVCAISPTQSCKNETYSTLRFAQRAKAIKNKAVVNEQMQNDVNTLREVIKQLKDELLRVKSTGNQVDPSAAGYSTGWNARRSLNLLKFSLNYPMNLPRIDDDGDEEMEIVEVSEEVNKKKMETGASGWIERKDSGDGDVNMEEDIYKNHEMNTHGDNQNPLGISQDLKDASTQNGDGDCVLPNLPIGPSEALKSLTPIVSPIINNSSRKSLRTSLRLTASQKEFTQTTISSEAFGLSEEENKKMETGASGWIERKDSGDGDVNMEEDIYKNHEMNTHGDNQNPLAIPQDLKDASTQNGDGDCVIPNLPIEPSEALKSPTPSVSPIINNSSRKSLRTSLRLTASQKELAQTTVSSVALGGSSFTFSKKPLESKPVSVGVQVLIEGNNNELQAEKPVTVLCRNCKCTVSSPDVTDHPNLQMVPVDDGSQLADKSKQLVPKAVEKVLAGAIRREMALEEFCTKQDSEINQLNCLLQQYKHERECNLIIGQIREDKIARLESLIDGILSVEEFKDNELSSLKNENKILKENYENHPEVLKIEIEFKRAREELECYQNFFDLGEKDVLLEEIQDLRSHLQSYLDSSSKKGNPVLQIMYPTDPSVASTLQDSADQSFDLKRTQWNEAERKYICVVENLERELQASRLLVEKQKHELETERRCSKELKEAMQMAMEGNARMLEQYADLEEKHIHLLATQRRIEDGIVDVKKAAARAGVKGAESKFINALAAEISTLKVEKEKEIHQYRDEFNGLKAQLKDTDEAVLAAGELLVRLKEAEEAAAAAEARAREAEQEKDEACKQIKELKRKQENGALTRVYDMPVYDSVEQESNSTKDQQWKEELVKIYHEDEGELSKLAEPSSWFSGYDACNI